MTRTQILVLAFFAATAVSVVAIRAAAPSVYDEAFNLPARGRPGHRATEIAFPAGLAVLLSVVAIAVRRRWRWMFWLILAAFLGGGLRVPFVILQLTGVFTYTTPVWYVAFQGMLGLAQFTIGLAMLAGYRHGGPWAAFPTTRQPGTSTRGLLHVIRSALARD